MVPTFEECYPNITRWVEVQGWIALGGDDDSSSLLRCLDPGGMVWESRTEHQTLTQALQALETALGSIFEEYGL